MVNVATTTATTTTRSITISTTTTTAAVVAGDSEEWKYRWYYRTTTLAAASESINCEDDEFALEVLIIAIILTVALTGIAVTALCCYIYWNSTVEPPKVESDPLVAERCRLEAELKEARQTLAEVEQTLAAKRYTGELDKQLDSHGYEIARLKQELVQHEADNLLT